MKSSINPIIRLHLSLSCPPAVFVSGSAMLGSGSNGDRAASVASTLVRIERSGIVVASAFTCDDGRSLRYSERRVGKRKNGHASKTFGARITTSSFPMRVVFGRGIVEREVYHASAMSLGFPSLIKETLFDRLGLNLQIGEI